MEITFSLSSSSIDRAVKQLKQYKNDLAEKEKVFLDRLAEEGISLVQDNLGAQGLGGSTLAGSVGSEQGEDENARVIFCDSDHVTYVEFGTGSNGESSPYPYDFPDGIEWNYNSGEHIFTTKDGKVGWIYPKDGEFYFTEGMESRPFMGSAAIQLRQRIVEIAREVFGNDK